MSPSVVISRGAALVPRFFFDLQDGQLFPDETGLELIDCATAHDHAIELAEAVLRKRSEDGRGGPWHILIKDEQRESIGSVTSVLI